jgi:hypothetical protein
VASSTNENVAFTSNDPVYVDAQRPVAEVVARMDVAQQALDRGAPQLVDPALTQALLDAVDHEQEAQAFNGPGSNGQLLGLLNMGGINLLACNTSSGVTVVQKALQAARLGAEFRLQPAGSSR